MSESGRWRAAGGRRAETACKGAPHNMVSGACVLAHVYLVVTVVVEVARTVRVTM